LVLGAQATKPVNIDTIREGVSFLVISRPFLSGYEGTFPSDMQAGGYASSVFLISAVFIQNSNDKIGVQLLYNWNDDTPTVLKSWYRIWGYNSRTWKSWNSI